MRQSEFKTYMKNLCEYHNELRHTDSECHYVWVIQPKVQDPFSPPSLWLENFINMKRTKLRAPFVIVENYLWSYIDNNSDNRIKKITWAFTVFDKAKEDDSAEINAALDKTERIGEDFLARMIEDFHIKLKTHNFRADDVVGEVVGPIDKVFWGNRFDCSAIFSNEANLTYDQSKWGVGLQL